MNTMEIIPFYLKGDKVRRTIWEKDLWVRLTDIGKIESDKSLLPENTELLYSPLTSLDKFGFYPDKMWEIYYD